MNRNIIIEVRGVSFVNKGAELMLHAVLEQLRHRYSNVKIVMEVNFGKGIRKAKPEMKKIFDNGLYIKPSGRRYKLEYQTLLSLVPKSILSKYNIILEKDINVILDASGFAFGDQWGVEFSRKRLTDKLSKWKGKKIILLSQAFGPFTKPGMRFEIENILENVNLVFARDLTSKKFLLDLSNQKNQHKIVHKPDFTNLIQGILPLDFDVTEHQVAIIPNFKMVVTTSQSDGEHYYTLLSRSIRHIQHTGFKPFFLMHEGKKDEEIANRINSTLENPIPIVWESHPVKIKGIIGSVYAVITSRFHGLVSALSQGTPCLATSWSHKYEMLLEDYDYLDGLLPLNDFSDVETKISILLDPEKNKSTKYKLNAQATEQKKLSREMWDLVFQEIDK